MSNAFLSYINVPAVNDGGYLFYENSQRIIISLFRKHRQP